MKKIISLVVMATMLLTLFAVNVSAAVPAGEKVVDLITAESFDSLENGWVESYSHAAAPPAGFVIKTDSVRGNVLSLYPTADGDTTSFRMMGLDGIEYTDKYELSFFIKSLVADCGFSIWLGDAKFGSNGGAHIDMANGDKSGNGSFVKDKWYEIKILVDHNASPKQVVKKRNVTDNGDWVTCTAKTEHFYGDGTYRFRTDAAKVWLSLGFGFCGGNWNDCGYGPQYSDDIEFYIDDVTLKGFESTPSEGVLLVQDYEGSSTALTTVAGGEGIIEVGEENGNKFGKLISNDKYGGFITGMVAAQDTWSDISFNNITLTFDAAWKNDTGVLSILVGKNIGGNDNQIAGTISLNIPKNEADKDKWYTYKVVGSGWGNPNETEGTWRGAAVYRKEKGSATWTEYTDVITHYNVDAGASAGNIVIGSYATKGGTIAAATEYWIDNLTVAKRESYSLPAVEVAGGNLDVTVAYENGGEMARATMTPVLATFSGGVLVDVDFAAKAAEAGLVTADLSASVLGADKAELYVWDGIGTAKPVKAAAIDLTSYLQ